MGGPHTPDRIRRVLEAVSSLDFEGHESGCAIQRSCTKGAWASLVSWSHNCFRSGLVLRLSRSATGFSDLGRGESDISHVNPLLGVFLSWLGGLASASFYVPFQKVRGWSWALLPV